MSAMLILIGFSLSVAIIFLIAFLWAVKSGQYKDRYTPSVRMLFDDKKQSNTNSKNHNNINRSN